MTTITGKNQPISWDLSSHKAFSSNSYCGEFVQNLMDASWDKRSAKLIVRFRSLNRFSEANSKLVNCSCWQLQKHMLWTDHEIEHLCFSGQEWSTEGETFQSVKTSWKFAVNWIMNLTGNEGALLSTILFLSSCWIEHEFEGKPRDVLSVQELLTGSIKSTKYFSYFLLQSYLFASITYLQSLFVCVCVSVFVFVCVCICVSW